MPTLRPCRLASPECGPDHMSAMPYTLTSESGTVDALRIILGAFAGWGEQRALPMALTIRSRAYPQRSWTTALAFKRIGIHDIVLSDKQGSSSRRLSQAVASRQGRRSCMYDASLLNTR